MAGTNWALLKKDAMGCKDQKELESLMIKCGIDKADVFTFIKRGVYKYGYDRNYRDVNGVSVKELKAKIRQYEEELGK